jgi:hypothetical protein
MSQEIWAGRCRDCFNDGAPLLELTEPNLAKPFVSGFCLCQQCHDSRMEDFRLGKEPRSIGIPSDVTSASWFDLEDIRIEFPHDPVIMVKVRVRLPNDRCSIDGGEVRMRIGTNQWWEPSEILDLETLGCDPNRLKSFALSGARMALHYRFRGVGGRVEGLS